MSTKLLPTLFFRFVVVGSVAVVGHPAFAGDEVDHYTIEEVQACSGDAMRLCRDALPDLHNIEACMEAKKALLSKACQAMFAPGRKRH